MFLRYTVLPISLVLHVSMAKPIPIHWPIARMSPDGQLRTFSENWQGWLVVAVAWGSILNLLMKSWEEALSVAERRRNDLVALAGWAMLVILTVAAFTTGIEDPEWSIEELSALALPWLVGGPALIDLIAALLRQLEMWRWLHRGSIEVMAAAWMMRTRTTREYDADMHWFARREWDRSRGLFAALKATTRRSTFYTKMSGWFFVLKSALSYHVGKLRKLEDPISSILVVFLCGFMLLPLQTIVLALSSIEQALMLACDFSGLFFRKKKMLPIINYQALYFGRREMATLFLVSQEVKKRLAKAATTEPIRNARTRPDGTRCTSDEIHDRWMGPMVVAAGVYENSFRNAYLVTPVYGVHYGKRVAIRGALSRIGIDVDEGVKDVRRLLEVRHTAGLLSMTLSEAQLHDNIQSALLVSAYYPTRVLHELATELAKAERASWHQAETIGAAELATAIEVTGIDTRHMTWVLLWYVAWANGDITREMIQIENDAMSTKEADEWMIRHNMDINELIGAAHYLSRIRYRHRYRLTLPGWTHPGFKEIWDEAGVGRIRGFLLRLFRLQYPGSTKSALGTWICDEQPWSTLGPVFNPSTLGFTLKDPGEALWLCASTPAQASSDIEEGMYVLWDDAVEAGPSTSEIL